MYWIISHLASSIWKEFCPFFTRVHNSYIKGNNYQKESILGPKFVFSLCCFTYGDKLDTINFIRKKLMNALYAQHRGSKTLFLSTGCVESSYPWNTTCNYSKKCDVPSLSTQSAICMGLSSAHNWPPSCCLFPIPKPVKGVGGEGKAQFHVSKWPRTGYQPTVWLTKSNARQMVLFWFRCDLWPNKTTGAIWQDYRLPTFTFENCRRRLSIVFSADNKFRPPS